MFPLLFYLPTLRPGFERLAVLLLCKVDICS